MKIMVVESGKENWKGMASMIGCRLSNFRRGAARIMCRGFNGFRDGRRVCATENASGTRFPEPGSWRAATASQKSVITHWYLPQCTFSFSLIHSFFP
jgi:hypothetical protein